jgi:hypothetical protein
MACTITSLIMFAVFGVLAVGFTNLPSLLPPAYRLPMISVDLLQDVEQRSPWRQL